MRIESFRNILVPLDFSENSLIALDHAVYLSRHLKSNITLLHIHETQNLSSTLRKLMFAHPSDEVILDKSVEEKLNEIAHSLQSKIGISVKTHNAKGRISTQIVKCAKDLGADLIVMGTHGASGMENFLAGSNTFNVVAGAHCPVISVLAHSGSKGIKDIVLPLDNSRETRQKVDEAIVFARFFNSTIHIVGVTISDDERDQFHVNKVCDQVERYIKEESVPCTRTFRFGANITNLTLDYAKEIDADLIVIMTEQEVNPTGFFMGPYAQQMINQSGIPVLSIRPKEREAHFILPY